MTNRPNVLAAAVSVRRGTRSAAAVVLAALLGPGPAMAQAAQAAAQTVQSVQSVQSVQTVQSVQSAPASAPAAASQPAAAPAGVTVTIPVGTADRKSEELPAGKTIELTLNQAISLALRNTLDLDVSSQLYEEAKFSLFSATGIFDPSLNAKLSASGVKSKVFQSFQASESQTQTGNVGIGGLTDWGLQYAAGWNNQRQDAPITSTIPGYQQVNPVYTSGVFANLTQPLLQNFGRDVNTRLVVKARIARDQAAWSFVSTVQTTIQSVENAYWDLLYAFADLKAKQEALDRAKDINRITRIKIDVGALAPIEIVQTEVTIAQREQAIILAEGAIGDAQDRLRRLLSVKGAPDWDRTLVPLDRPGPEGFRPDLEKGIDTALRMRPEVKQAVVDIESKKIELVYQKNQVKPQLNLVASVGANGAGAQLSDFGINYIDALYDIRSVDYPNWSVGLNFSVPLGNRAAKGLRARASVDLDLSRTNLAVLKLNLQVEVRTAARNIDTAGRSVTAAKKARELAERNLDAERKKFDNGMTTAFQVAQVQNDLTTAITQELQAILGYQRSVTSWYKATGELLKVKNIVLEGLPVETGPTAPVEGAIR